MTINSPKILEGLAPPPPRLKSKFLKYLKDIEEGNFVPQEDYGFWVWAAAKFYKESASNAWIFWMKLDMNYTGHFSQLGEQYQEDNLLGYSVKNLPRLLQYFSIKEIRTCCMVSKLWRRAIWMCFFDCPPKAYAKEGKGIKVIWF